MPVTVVTAPDGTEYEVNHPDTATDEEILAYARQEFGKPAAEDEQNASAREQFMYANILIGLSLLLEDKQNKKSGRAEKDGDNIESVEDRVERTCRALASFIPAIITLGSSDLEAVDLVDEIVESA